MTVWSARGRAAAALGVSLALVLVLPYPGFALSGAGFERVGQFLCFLPQFAFPRRAREFATLFWGLTFLGFSFGAAHLRPRWLVVAGPLTVLIGVLLLDAILLAAGVR